MNNYLKASVWLADKVEQKVGEDGELLFVQMTFAEAVIQTCAAIELVRPKNKRSFFVLGDKIGYELAEISKSDCAFYDACCQICAHNIFAGQPVPYSLINFAADVLHGKIKRPSPPSRPRSRNWLEQCFLYNLIKHAAQTFCLPITRNDASPKHSACDAMAEALTSCGRKTSYSQMKSLMVHSDKARLRAEFEAYDRMSERAITEQMPFNALTPTYHEARDKEAEKTVRDILATFPTTPKKSD